MRTYKRVLAVLLCVLLAAGIFAGCGKAAQEDDGKLNVVVTIFPEYDWVREILGDRLQDVSLTLLMDSGADLHSYQPTPKDIATISKCDIFLYTGGVSDKWVQDVLAQAENKDLVVIDLMAALGDRAKEEETVEGMEDDHDHEDHDHEDEDHDHEDGEHDAHDAEHRHGEIEYDEHVWLSLKNAAILCGVIRDKLCAADPDHADTYKANAETYIGKLNDLDAKYQTAAENAEFTTVLFADRFPFRYLADDCGLRYYAAFAGCSAETEASFETIAFLSAKVDELGLRSILQIESANGSIARTVRDNTATRDQQILTMDSMQSVTPADIKEGATYLGIMEQNLEVLKQAIGSK